MRRHFVTEPQPIAALTPNESAPLVALLGGGGTGKSNIARRLVQDLMEHEKCPVLLDLKNYHSEMKLELASAAWSALTASERSSVERDVLESVLFHATVPRRSRQEMEMLAAEMELVSIVDGLNEIPPTEQKLLLDFLRSLSGDSRAYVVVTARLGLRDNLDGFTFAVVDRLSESEVQEEYDRQFGDGAYAHLEATVQQILRRPFFLALAMRGSELAGLKSWSGIFERFFSERIKLHSVSLRALAENVFESFNELGTFDVVKFKQLVVEKEYENLVDAEVLSRHDRGFDHELWRDFLAAKHLSQHSELWVQDNFDRVTTKASSFECFPLTIEQIADPAKRDAFVKTVYDWSVAGAVECLYYAEGDDRGDISPGLRVAMLAVIAEKQFDRMENTRIKALSQLRGQRSEIAGRFTGLTSRGKLVSVVADTGINDAWFNQWFAMFSTSDLSDAADTLVQEVESLDSVLGWTAANVIKRLRLDASQLSALCDSYVSRATDVTANAIRWRVVHALGAFPEAGAIATLEVAAKSDPSMWVRYGATRSLIEIAAMGTAATRPPALKALFSALPEVKKAPKIERRRVLLEALNAAFVRGAAADWDDDALPLLSLIVELAEPSDVSEFSEVLRRFESKEWPR